MDVQRAGMEPWMRGTHLELDPLRRGVVQALEMCEEDAERWAVPLTEVEMFARPFALPSVAFHLRHLARSLDRLLSYAEGRSLNELQLAELGSEMGGGPDADLAEEVMAEFRQALAHAKQRVRAFAPGAYSEPRGIGRQRLPTTVGGLLVHCAEHSQRHAGQMVTTAKVVRSTR